MRIDDLQEWREQCIILSQEVAKGNIGLRGNSMFGPLLQKTNDSVRSAMFVRAAWSENPWKLQTVAIKTRFSPKAVGTLHKD